MWVETKLNKSKILKSIIFDTSKIFLKDYVKKTLKNFFKKNTVENYRLLTNSNNLVNNIYTKNSTKNSQHLMEIEVEIDFK